MNEKKQEDWTAPLPDSRRVDDKLRQFVEEPFKPFPLRRAT